MTKRKLRTGPKAKRGQDAKLGAAAPPQLDAAQIEAMQAQAAQRLRTEHAVLKSQFADVSVALAIVSSERDQLITQLRSAQATLEKLTEQASDKGKPPKEA